MIPCLFASDLHGRTDRYEKLFREIESRKPSAVFLGGDLLPSPLSALSEATTYDDFVGEFLAPNFESIKHRLKRRYPKVFLILGNDDGRADEPAVSRLADQGLWHYAQNRSLELAGYRIYGYAYVPPTPFLCKDWERYDVSRYVPPGSVSPEEGWRSLDVDPQVLKHSTIEEDLDKLADDDPLDRAIFLFHTPPHETALDRAALDGKMIDHVPFDLHVGSIAVRRFIEVRQPLLTLHGHVHESARLTGRWRDRIGRTHMFSAAHDGAELALVEFDPENLEGATRHLL